MDLCCFIYWIGSTSKRNEPTINQNLKIRCTYGYQGVQEGEEEEFSFSSSESEETGPEVFPRAKAFVKGSLVSYQCDLSYVTMVAGENR